MIQIKKSIINQTEYSNKNRCPPKKERYLWIINKLLQPQYFHCWRDDLGMKNKRKKKASEQANACVKNNDYISCFSNHENRFYNIFHT